MVIHIIVSISIIIIIEKGLRSLTIKHNNTTNNTTNDTNNNNNNNNNTNNKAV